ncbi:hypothetical protein NJ7G_0590 [Natrinema sp. J7-2]|nr:hypothetical protein NJ7G_0590 [Natrinema sp. J7-2]
MSLDYRVIESAFRGPGLLDSNSRRCRLRLQRWSDDDGSLETPREERLGRAASTTGKETLTVRF